MEPGNPGSRSAPLPLSKRRLQSFDFVIIVVQKPWVVCPIRYMRDIKNIPPATYVRLVLCQRELVHGLVSKTLIITS